jgi:hypothetical protein
VKDENGDILADFHNILNRWKNYFSQLLTVHNINDVRQIKVHTAEPLVPGLSRFQAEIVIIKFEKYRVRQANFLYHLAFHIQKRKLSCRQIVIKLLQN